MLRERALKLVHNGIFTLHQGSEKCLSMLSKYLFWPNMAEDITNFCLQCTTCNLYTKSNLPNLSQGRLKYFGSLLDLVYTDLIGPFRKSSNLTYILAIMDAFSSHILLYGISTTTGENIVNKIFTKYIPCYGIPIAMFSDNRSQFKNKLIQILALQQDIKWKYSSALCNPTSNSLIEENIYVY